MLVVFNPPTWVFCGRVSTFIYPPIRRIPCIFWLGNWCEWSIFLYAWTGKWPHTLEISLGPIDRIDDRDASDMFSFLRGVGPQSEECKRRSHALHKDATDSPLVALAHSSQQNLRAAMFVTPSRPRFPHVPCLTVYSIAFNLSHHTKHQRTQFIMCR